MKWKNEEIEKAHILLKEGKTYKEIGDELSRTDRSIKSKLEKLGIKYNHYNIAYETRECSTCKVKFTCTLSSEKRFCNRSCAATLNNKLFKKKARINPSYSDADGCLQCCGPISYPKKFCSKSCAGQYRTGLVYKRIEKGDKGVYEGSVRRYLIEKYGAKCMQCGWNEINKATGMVPIQLDHVDGDSSNNSLQNTRLLCPNCHSLTPTYMALNKGNGRKKRYDKV